MAEQESPSYGFSNSYEPSPQAKALGKVIEILEDPRNSWMGLGPMSAAMGMVKGPGWGAEALRRYKLIGGTPETLNKVFKDRAVDPNIRRDIVRNFQQATDIAAPPTATGLQNLQQGSMDLAGRGYQILRQGGRPHLEDEGWRLRLNETTNSLGPRSGIGKYTAVENTEEGFQRRKELGRASESASSGNAAYGATSRQVARMLDTPGFKFSKAEDLPSATDTEYWKMFPIKSDELARAQYDRFLATRQTPAERRANVNNPENLRSGLGALNPARRASDTVPGAGATRNRWPNNQPPYMGEERRVAGGGLDRRILNLFDEWQRDERTLTAEEMNLLRQHYGDLPE